VITQPLKYYRQLAAAVLGLRFANVREVPVVIDIRGSLDEALTLSRVNRLATAIVVPTATGG
jgi:hypothetical protein